MTWSPNNLACTTTWATLFALDESVRPFPTSGDVRIKDFAFWISAATPELRTITAQRLAMRMDAIFRLVRGAVYEEGKTHDRAIADLTDVLCTGDATMETLADVNDANYRFWQEAT